MVLLVNKVETSIDEDLVDANSKEKLDKEPSKTKSEKSTDEVELVEEVKATKTKKGKIEAEPDTKHHRKRAKERYLKYGISGMKDYEVLELILFFCIQRKDTKALAKKLIRDFGSFACVLDADVEELVKYKDITLNGAVLLKLFIDVTATYGVDKITHIDKVDTYESNRNICEYFKMKLFGSTKEVVYVMFLDSRHRLISCDLIGEGDLTSVHFKNSHIIELALKHKAMYLAMAHTHPDGTARPSHADVTATAELKKCLSFVDVIMVEHVIVTPKECVSMFEGGYLI